MPVKVSVIVPVYNPGPYLEDCVASLLRQSMPPDAYEVIFVDDGSTDGTPARLDALTAEDPRVRVVHQENSGWSGKPRNVGIAAARGEYVMFVDHDDLLGDEALERMYDYGVANGADVVVGKMAGKGRGVPVELFRTNRPRATVANAPLIDSLTPHKMVRRAFLDGIGLRFPEGRRRLEDHVFVAEAYLRAENVSVLSDYVCYYHVKRDDESNAGFRRFEPAGYFKNLREALDVVERYTEPGPLRDRLFRRWLRVEMVERLRGRRFLDLPEDYRRELFDEIHGVVVERFGPGVAAGLPPAQRVVAALAAAGRFDDAVAFAEWEAALALRAVPVGVEWRDGMLRIEFTAEFIRERRPLEFPAGPFYPGEPPLEVSEAVTWVCADAVERFAGAPADLRLRERASGAPYFQPVEVTRETVPVGDGTAVRLVLRVTAAVDPARAASGGPLGDGLWDAFVRVRLGGWTKECRLGPAPQAGSPTPYDAGVVDGLVVLPYWTRPHASLALDVGRAGVRLGLGGITPGDVTVEGGRLRAVLPLYVPRPTGVLLRLTGDGASVDVPGTLSPANPSGLEVALPVGEMSGTRRVALCLAPDAGSPRFHALPFALRLGFGGARVVPVPRPGLAQRLARRVRRALGTALGVRRA
ncbi:glycosyltransferase family 2 protein [Streptomyces sp. NPDC048751]|uniref:glycosyltransferase family 2 protein n=1 Tax=Streptomyces sp. NPDC048751 TaxID=3365591 RepID=UPI0037239F92